MIASASAPPPLDFQYELEFLARGTQSCDPYFPVKPKINLNKRLPPTPTTQKNDTGKYYLFIIGLPSGGTTVIYSLLGTSPEASNLCAFVHNGGLCEGTNFLLGKGLVPVRKDMWRFDAFKIPWETAVRKVYPQRWNMSKPVLLEKSPPTLGRVSEIYQALKSDPDRQVRFIVVTMSSCRYVKNWGMAFQYQRNMGRLAKELDAIPRSVWHHVKMEDMFADPYKEVQGILDFLPALRLLDPTRTSLERRNPKATSDHNRMASVVDFIKMKGEMPNRTTHFWPVGLMQKFGYIDPPK